MSQCGGYVGHERVQGNGLLAVQYGRRSAHRPPPSRKRCLRLVVEVAASSGFLDPAHVPPTETDPNRSFRVVRSGAAIVIGEQVITRPASIAIALIALALLLQRRLKIPEAALVAAAAATGILAFN